MANGFLVYIESNDGNTRKGSLECLAAARSLADRMGWSVTAVVFEGGDVLERVKKFGPYRIVEAKVGDAPMSRDIWILVLERIIRQEEAAYVLATASSRGKDILPGVSARFELGVIQDVTGIDIDGDELVITRPIYAGKAYETVKPAAHPAFISLRPNVFPADEKEGGAPEVTSFPQEINPDDLRTIIQEIKTSAGSKVELTEAGVIVSGGRGIKGPENYQMIEDLANLLGGAAGASRAVVDAGWVDHQHQVGQTGKTVSPSLYIAIGISGAIQHLAGMSSSKYIVAINKDPDAPIFKVADYGIVGDLFKIVPLLTDALKKYMDQ